MGKDLRHRWPVRALELQHALDEVLEFLTEVRLLTWLIFAVGSPENIGSVSSQASVEWISWLSSGEWWMLCNHDEMDNG